MTDETGGPRLSSDDVEAYFGAGFLSRRKVLDQPECILEFDPSPEEIRLRTPASADAAELSGFERISTDVVQDLDSTTMWAELRVNAVGSHYEAYLVVASIVDMMRSGLSFATAIAASVDSFRDLLKPADRLTEEAQTGLFGELMIVEHALRSLPEQEVITAWLGPDNEEHDFVFASFDAEVKTTRSEGRVHLISSMSQLEASIGRSLHLLSIQLTDGGAAKGGRTLGELVTAVRIALDARYVRIFDSRLAMLGWREADASQYPHRWMLRTAPRAYIIDDEFPAITRSRLLQTVPQPHLVTRVQYRVDVTNLTPSPAPEPLQSFCAIRGAA
jgi:hypothetical protein